MLDTNRPAFVRAYLSGVRKARAGEAATACPFSASDRRKGLSRYLRDLEFWWLLGWKEFRDHQREGVAIA